jgi:hypothetical protein
MDVIACYAIFASYRFPLVGRFKRERQEDIGIRIVMHNTHTKEIRKLCVAGKLTSQDTMTQGRERKIPAPLRKKNKLGVDANQTHN